MDFGGLGGIDALDPGLPSLTPLYSGLTKAFKDEGYEERVDLFGAPYDFRLAGDGLEQVLWDPFVHDMPKSRDALFCGIGSPDHGCCQDVGHIIFLFGWCGTG